MVPHQRRVPGDSTAASPAIASRSARTTVAVDLIETRLADDDELCGRITDLVNRAYAIGEAGMWQPGTTRTTRDGIARLIAQGELVGAWFEDDPVGCVRLHRIDPSTWGFGMLAVDPDRQSGGAGSALIDAAERIARSRGAARMQLEILVPIELEQPSKARLRSWYARRGYLLTATGRLEDDHPELVPALAVECTFEVWQKPLSPLAGPGRM